MFIFSINTVILLISIFYVSNCFHFKISDISDFNAVKIKVLIFYSIFYGTAVALENSAQDQETF